MSPAERAPWYVEPGLLGALSGKLEIILSGDDARRYQTLALALDSCFPDSESSIDLCHTRIAFGALWWPS